MSTRWRGSIAPRGVIVPLVVRPAGASFELVAGFHRFAAAVKLGMTEVPVVVREQEGTSADSAAENIVRKALTPLEPRGRSMRCSTAATRWTAPRRLWAGAVSWCALAPRS
jgi:ParB/RepB/Spo0J family partition protein